MPKIAKRLHFKILRDYCEEASENECMNRSYDTKIAGALEENLSES